MTLRTVALALFCVLPVQAQDPVLAAAEQELIRMFDRPAGTTIGDGHKQALAQFLERWQGRDLAQLSYAHALHRYLQRDYDGAVIELDRFFDRFADIGFAEHRTMAGRIYLNAVRTEGDRAAPDLDRLTRWGERMTRLYSDAQMLGRIAKAVAARLQDPAAFRVALARGVFQSELPAADKDAFLAVLYAESGPQGAVRGDAAAPGPRSATTPQESSRAVQPGQQVTSFPVQQVLNGPERFDLDQLRGKVVVLDFFATWCPPCRAGVPDLVDLQTRHGDRVQVVAVTRFYGRGMDFADPAATRPHGGKAVADLDREREIAVNQAFLKAFGVNYPLVFADEELARERFGVTGIPTLFVVGRDGTLLGKVVGTGTAQQRELEALVERGLR